MQKPLQSHTEGTGKSQTPATGKLSQAFHGVITVRKETSFLCAGSDLPSAPPAPFSASQLPSLVLLPKVMQQPQRALGERATFRSPTHFN